MAENLDVIVIGAGPVGWMTATRVAQLKQKIAIVNKQSLGGTVLHDADEPSSHCA